MSTESSTSAPLAGQILDQKYEVGSPLGSGGSGTVFLARHVFMERNVAIKVLHPSFAADEALRSRFFREARVTSILKHPNVVTVHDFGIYNDMPYLVMEYVNGQTLRNLLTERGSLSVKELAPIALQVCRALSAAHELGVVHRDLKPENVVLSKDGDRIHAKVLDFGIAKLCEPEKTGGVDFRTEDGIFQGTPRYAAPEQIRNKNIDGRTDVYSFGVMLYEALTGRPPFVADTSMDLVLMHLNSTALRPSEQVPELDCPPELESVIMRCLAKSADDRYASIKELTVELETICGPDLVGYRRSNRRSMLSLAASSAMLLTAVVLYGTTSAARQIPEMPPPPPPAPYIPLTEKEKIDGLLSECQKAYFSKSYYDAAAICRSVLTKRPDDVSAKLHLSLSYKKIGRVEEAIALLETVDQGIQESQSVAYQLALLNAQIGQMDKALKELERAAKDNEGIKERARKETVFAPLKKNPQYRKIVSAPPLPTVRKKEREGSTIERNFGRFLEGINRSLF